MNLAELCKGSTADSDSVCLGSNPSSAAIEIRPPIREVVFLSLWQWNRGFEHSFLPVGKNWGSIPRVERVELARKRQALVSSPKANTLVPLYTSHRLDDIHGSAVIWREVLATLPILCYTNSRKAVEL